MFVDKKIESYFCDRLTFSYIRSRTSHRIDKLAQSLLSPETLSSSSKSRISYIMHTFLCLSGWMTQLPAQTHRQVPINTYTTNIKANIISFEGALSLL